MSSHFGFYTADPGDTAGWNQTPLNLFDLVRSRGEKQCPPAGDAKGGRVASFLCLETQPMWKNHLFQKDG